MAKTKEKTGRDISKKRIRGILDVLEKTYPDARSGLRYANAFELLIAAILSAQTTDKQVNRITKDLFERFPSPEDMAALSPEELEPYIKSCGVYRNKAKNIVGASRMLVERHDSKVPGDMQALLQLPGVGRKTANVVLANAFGANAIAVDTHVFRVANRLGLATAKDALHTEQQLMESIPEEKWSMAHHWLIWHGRRVCTAQKPKCRECPLQTLCRYYERLPEK
ncbi:MAG: endonuclease III [Bacillota bacterium]